MADRDLEKMADLARQMAQLQQQAQKLGKDLAEQLQNGEAQAAATALSVDLLRVPAGLLHVAGSAWASGDPVAGLGALFWEPGAAQVDDLVASAVDGDFKGAAEAGVKAITIGVATGVALGELGGAAAEAAKDVEGGTAGSGDRPAPPRPPPGARPRRRRCTSRARRSTRCSSTGSTAISIASTR